MASKFTGTREYASWHAMRQRCNNPHATYYEYYGGRGIRVCNHWAKFANFLKDMGERPIGKTLDRFPDRNGNYEPRNCRWATWREQAFNRRRRVDVRGFRFKPGHRKKPWQAIIAVGKRQYSLGCFRTRLEAHQAYLKAEKELR